MTDGPATPQDPATAPEAAPNPTQAPASQPSARPRPAYGELAPEGWEWKPEGDDTHSVPPAGAVPAAPVHAPAAPVAPTIPGVPHNLGAGLPKGRIHKAASPAASGSGAPQDSSAGQGQQAPGSPYRAAPPQSPVSAPAPPQQPGASLTGTRKPRTADRVITILLLVMAAYGALSVSSSMFSLKSQIHLTATMIGIDDPALATWIAPLGTITGIVTLALFAVTLIYSIQRMRARKLAFWVPLAAGAVAIVLALIVTSVAMMAGAPEIMEQLNADPNGSVDKMFEYIQQMQP